MYKVDLDPVPARIQVSILESLSEQNLNRNKLANDCLATLISADQRGLMLSLTGVAPSMMKNKMFSDSSKPRIIKLRKDLVDYMEMQGWNKSGAINQALIYGLKEISSGARFASNYQSGRRQHYRPTAANKERNSTVKSDEITPPWSFDKCCINGEWQGAQICGFCAHYNVRGRFCAYDLKFKTALDFCSRFIERREGTYYICARCMNYDKQCKFGTEPNRRSHNCQAYYPAP